MAKKSKKTVVKEEAKEIKEVEAPKVKYLTEIELKNFQIFSKDASISELKSETLALKISNTELTIKNLQHQLDLLRSEHRRSIDNVKMSKDKSRHYVESVKARYNIEGKFAYDPLSGELITE